MSEKDFYRILGVSENASTEEIKKACRHLVKKYHPDRNKGDKQTEERFKEINEAYDILGDAAKRKNKAISSVIRAAARKPALIFTPK